jgi:molecular chaperone GrpE
MADPTNPDAAPGAAPAADAPAGPNGTGAAESQDAVAPDPMLAHIADLEARLAEATDQHLRAHAEAQNIRRRAEEETAKARRFAIEGFAESLLPVRDSLEAALANAKGAPDKLIEGVETTLRQLTSAFERNRVVEIAPPAGTKFDPHQHQAISAVPSDQDANTIVAVLQKGYLINERILRPALVTVSAPTS